MNSADRQVFNLGILISIIAVLGAAVAGGELDLSESDGGGANGEGEDTTYETSTSGNLQEGDSVEIPVDPDGMTALMGTFILTWEDEADLPLHENEPDRFSLKVEAPDGETVDEDSDDDGHIAIEIDFVDEKGYKGEWLVTITLVNAGDQTWLGIGPNPLIGDDDSNDYSLDVEIEWRND